jgi:hypothetical protein
VEQLQEEFKSNIYRFKYIAEEGGYVVYRHCFEYSGNWLNRLIIEHKEAIFVAEIVAKDYCRYRNLLMDIYGIDRLPCS